MRLWSDSRSTTWHEAVVPCCAGRMAKGSEASANRFRRRHADSRWCAVLRRGPRTDGPAGTDTLISLLVIVAIIAIATALIAIWVRT